MKYSLTSKARICTLRNSGKFQIFRKLLKDNLPHNTCQIYVKPHSKSTQMTLEYHIFDEKALE